jgi:hypothetical protein
MPRPVPEREEALASLRTAAVGRVAADVDAVEAGSVVGHSAVPLGRRDGPAAGVAGAGRGSTIVDGSGGAGGAGRDPGAGEGGTPVTPGTGS